MPELPEVEVLVRHLAPLLKNKTVRRIEVRRTKVLQLTTERQFKRALLGAKIRGVARRGKYLVFTLRHRNHGAPIILVGHLGMTGRMYLQRSQTPWPKHAAVILNLGRCDWIYQDTRYFGRLTLDTRSLDALGPEPLSPDFTLEYFCAALKRSAQPIKVKLLDQTLVAGVGNIYASEALFRAGLSPRLASRRLRVAQVERLWRAVRDVLTDAIHFGSTVPLNWDGTGKQNGLFYYGQTPDAPDFYTERLRVYDRAGQPCVRCRTPIQRTIQAARSTYACPRCQRA